MQNLSNHNIDCLARRNRQLVERGQLHSRRCNTNLMYVVWGSTVCLPDCVYLFHTWQACSGMQRARNGVFSTAVEYCAI